MAECNWPPGHGLYLYLPCYSYLVVIVPALGHKGKVCTCTLSLCSYSASTWPQGQSMYLYFTIFTWPPGQDLYLYSAILLLLFLHFATRARFVPVLCNFVISVPASFLYLYSEKLNLFCLQLASTR